MKIFLFFIMVTMAALIPAMIFSIDVLTQSKTLTITDTLEEETTIEELIVDTPLIIKGTVLSSTIDTNPNDPRDISTIWNIRISEVLKGDYAESHIDVKQRGGETSTHMVQVEGAAKLVNQEEVILFLAINPNSSYGDYYYLMSQYVGKYTLENGQLTTYLSGFNTSEKEMRNKIQTSLQ